MVDAVLLPTNHGIIEAAILSRRSFCNGFLSSRNVVIRFDWRVAEIGLDLDIRIPHGHCYLLARKELIEAVGLRHKLDKIAST